MKLRNTSLNLIGIQFGNIVITSSIIYIKNRQYVNGKCVCGLERFYRLDHLKSSHTTSCGCQKKLRLFKHGYSQNCRLYKTWRGMIDRCYLPKSHRYKYYGGKGISVCDEWRYNFKLFYEWAMLHGYSDKLTIDRIDNDKNYDPSNCRFATAKEQANHRINNRYLELNNQIKPIAEWCQIYNIDRTTVDKRIKRGWTTENALTCSVERKNK